MTNDEGIRAMLALRDSLRRKGRASVEITPEVLDELDDLWEQAREGASTIGDGEPLDDYLGTLLAYGRGLVDEVRRLRALVARGPSEPERSSTEGTPMTERPLTDHECWMLRHILDEEAKRSVPDQGLALEILAHDFEGVGFGPVLQSLIDQDMLDVTIKQPLMGRVSAKGREAVKRGCPGPVPDVI